MSEILKFSFKGSRDYVHGTSLFNALVNAANQAGLDDGRINVSFKQMIHNPVCLLEQRLPQPGDAVVAKFSGPSGAGFTLCINGAIQTEQTGRQEFNEAEVCLGAVLGERSIVHEISGHPDRIELVVSLCKKMHQECLDGSRKWVFSRYDGLFPIPAEGKVELRIMKQVGVRLTCSDVLINGKKIGDIYFS